MAQHHRSMPATLACSLVSFLPAAVAQTTHAPGPRNLIQRTIDVSTGSQPRRTHSGSYTAHFYTWPALYKEKVQVWLSVCHLMQDHLASAD